MKKLILASFLVLSSVVQAGEILLSDKSLRIGNSFYSGEFEINEELGRAWVELSFSTYTSEDMPDVERIQVKGLAFDKTTKEVYLETSTGRVVCAYQKRGLFGVRSLKETRDCKFKSLIYKTSYDNGFEIVHIEKEKVFLAY